MKWISIACSKIQIFLYIKLRNGVEYLYFLHSHHALGKIQYRGDRKSLELCLERQYLLYDRPQLDSQTGSLAGVKVIVGGYSPELGWIHCHLCIPIAEKTGLIGLWGKLILDKTRLAVSAMASSRTNSA